MPIASNIQDTPQRFLPHRWIQRCFVSYSIECQCSSSPYCWKERHSCVKEGPLLLIGYYFLIELCDFSDFVSFSRYPNYEFISDNSISWSAGLHNRYTENSLRGVILDIHFLSQADFLVCTFSSQVSIFKWSILWLY